jgi:hypothetical protein
VAPRRAGEEVVNQQSRRPAWQSCARRSG